MGSHKKAIGAYKKFIEIKPDDHKAYHNMGIAYYKLKEYQAAIDAFEKAIKIKPDAYENYNSVGAAYIKLFGFFNFLFCFFGQLHLWILKRINWIG
jgi:tetratricopeptide (TPR) repeat protein